MIGTVCWRLSTWDPDLASVRYRAAIPAIHLARQGVASRFSARPHRVLDEADAPDVVIFAKAFGDSDVEQAREAATAGIPVLLDVCDNVFAPAYRAHSPDNVRRIAEVATAIVTTGPALAEVLEAELGGRQRVEIVPDPVESLEDTRRAARLIWREHMGRALRHAPREVPHALASAVLRRPVAAVARRLRRPRKIDLPQVLWFGNAGSVEPRFGLVNLTDVADQLLSAAREVPFRLLVVSSDRKMYRDQVEGLGLETAFARWDRELIFRHLQESSVVIAPNSRDPFSICKSANRATLALSQGVPVVATRIPSLDALAGCVIFDDFHHGVVDYLRDRQLAAQHLRRAERAIAREFRPDVVAERWLRLLSDVAHGPARISV